MIIAFIAQWLSRSIVFNVYSEGYTIFTARAKLLRQFNKCLNLNNVHFAHPAEIKIDENLGDIESVIILDRSIDFLTPLLKQTVYEGIAD
jgi:hypothetical protein